MAMVRPIGLNVPSFDATEDHIFQFVSNGGNQVVKNKIIIKNNVTNELVYEKTTETYSFSSLVPANTLTNGEYYSYSFITYDVLSNESPESDPISFYCYTKPEFKITNIPSNAIINSATYNFTAIYNQIEGELLDFAVFNLYDESDNLISTSGSIYNTSELPLNFEYTFDGFEDDKIYKISIDGVTVNNNQITSGKYTFGVNYYYPSLFSRLDLTNKCNEGYIEINSNIIIIDGVTNAEPPKYIDGEKIDLTNGDYVEWVDGYNINKDFTIQIHLENPFVNGKLDGWYTDGKVETGKNTPAELKRNDFWIEVSDILENYTDGIIYISKTEPENIKTGDIWVEVPDSDYNNELGYIENLDFYNGNTKNVLVLWNKNDTSSNPERIEICFIRDYNEDPEDEETYVLAECRIYQGDSLTNYIYSNYMNNLDSKIQIWLRRINNIYEIKLEAIPDDRIMWL